MKHIELEKLQSTIKIDIEIRKDWEENIFKKSNDDQQSLLMNRGAGIVWYCYEKLALQGIFIDKDIMFSKQQFYTCGKLDEYSIVKHDAKILDYGINHMAYALLSDHQGLIQKYAQLSHSNYEAMIKSGSSTPLYVIQCIIKEDRKEYERAIEIVQLKTLKKFPAFELDLSFYKALMDRDKNLMEQILSEFVSPKIHKLRNKNFELINQFISHPALGYAKLAWLKGIEVEVNSPLIPKELLPVRPLAKYVKEYDFLLDD